jgi:RimJ/RimL family protein N-acetyltransferase
MLSTEEVSHFISPPPTTVEGFERFIAWTHRERAAGNDACFAVVPHGMDTAIGIFQVRQLEPGFATAEWGFAIGVRKSFLRNGDYLDQTLWTILDDDWRTKSVWGGQID